MKIVTLMRHAKSSWGDLNSKDIDRQIIEKGVKQTLKIVDFLNASSFSTDCIITSSAKRTQQTTQLLSDYLENFKGEITVEPSLYSAEVDTFYELIFGADPAYQSLLIVGHNPVITAFVNQFLDKPIDWMPTSGVVSISFDTERWQDIPLATRTVLFVKSPSELG